MRRVLILFVAGLALLVSGGCHAAQVRYQPLAELLPQSEAPEATVFLLGDGGESSAGRDAVLSHLGERVAEITGSGRGSPVVAVFLGDNIYDVGARLDFEEEDLAKLTAQVQPLGISADVSAFFLPGNHDWAKGAGIGEGRRAIQVQQDWLERISGGRDVRLLPDDSCPGPDTVDVTESIHLVFIDTEWLLRRPEDDCGDPGVFYERLREDLVANRGKRVIVLSHHPMTSGGPHGGNVAPFEHGPLVYYLSVKTGVSVQDIASGAYTSMVERLRSTFEASGSPPLIHAAGHDHSLQLIRNDGSGLPRYQLVSGSASKTSSVARIDGTRYATDGYGYMQLDFHRDRVRLVVYAKELGGGAVRPVYACSMTDGRPSECPEANLLGAPQ